MALPWPLLVADIGGTNCRVGVVTGPGLRPERLEIVPTAVAPTAAEALQAIAFRHGIVPRSVALAVAGVVQGGRAELTNSAWTFDLATIIATMGVEAGLLVNDFAALAASLLGLADDQVTVLAAGRSDPEGAQLVLGPGTGFGVAALVPRGQDLVIVPSEAGHVALGPETFAEAVFWPHLPQDSRITYETLLCGQGLVLVADAIARSQGRRPEHRAPEEITAAAQAGKPEASEAIIAFLDLLARVTGDLALAFRATGGVMLAGGVTQKLAAFIDAARFTGLFRDKPPMTALLQAIPLGLITSPDAAEQGLAALAADPDRFGIAILRGREGMPSSA